MFEEEKEKGVKKVELGDVGEFEAEAAGTTNGFCLRGLRVAVTYEIFLPGIFRRLPSEITKVE